MSNPMPYRITDPMWRMWTEGRKIIPGVLLGGIYANKRGYHNTRKANQLNWSGNYSVRLSLDLQGPSDKAAAIDYTMSSTEMRRRTGYLRDAVERSDPRLAAVREFYGTLNGNTVYGRIKDSRNGDWDSSSADNSHLWHIHISIFRAYVDQWSELEPILSVLTGESLESWLGRQGTTAPLGNPVLEVTDPLISDVRVGRLQTALNELGENLDVDNYYGPNTAAAVRRFQEEEGIASDGIYGPETEASLRQALEDAMTISNEDLDRIAQAVWERRNPWTDDWVRERFGLRDDGWRALTQLQSIYGHTRTGSEKTSELIAGQAAIIARLDGGDDGTIRVAIREELERHYNEKFAELGEELVGRLVSELSSEIRDLPAETVEQASFRAVAKALAQLRVGPVADDDQP